MAGEVFLHAADLADVLACGRLDLLVGGVGLEAPEGGDVPPIHHRRTDASKVALVGLVDLLRAGDAKLLDVQWKTDHLATLGAIEVPRAAYLELLAEAIEHPLPGVFTG